MAYIVVDLPHGVPETCKEGQQLYIEDDWESNTDQEMKAKEKAFSFSKALSGATLKEHVSACTTRGDGKFDDGGDIVQKGNVVYLGPDALSEGNAEKTAQFLDSLSKTGTKASSSQPAAHTQSPGDSLTSDITRLFNATAPPKSSYHAIATAAADLLFDLSEDPKSSSKAGPSSTSIIREPSHTLKEGADHYELSVSLPDISGMKEVELTITKNNIRVQVPAKYKLQVKLAKDVDDSAASAKWLKNKQTLVVHLPLKIT